MITMKLSGFMTRQWHNPHGGKFRKQIMRRAAQMGGAYESVDVRDVDGFAVDYYMCDKELKEYDDIGKLLIDQLDEQDHRAIGRDWLKATADADT